MAVAAAPLPHLTVPRRPALRLVEAPVGPAPGVAPSRALLRRRRLVAGIVAALAVLLVALGLVALWPSASIAEQVAEPAPVVVVVGEGETVWDVVAPHVPAGTDRRAFVAEVVAANDVEPGAIQPGTALRLP